jgi:putative ABC transport system permease protein
LVKQDLFGEENPIGKFINGGGRTWKVIGVFQDDGGDNEERYIYAPYTTIQSIQRGSDNVGQIIITYKPEIGFDGALELEKKIKSFVKNRKKIDPADPRGIFIRSASNDLKESEDFSNVLKMIVSFVGLGTLLAGIIGISNIMVYVVKERTKELGIRKAIGATPKSIVWMVLQESIFITTISGYIGLFMGVMLLSSIGDSLEEDFYIIDPYVDLYTALLATLMLIVFGGIAGFIPAKKASNIKPIEALNDK